MLTSEQQTHKPKQSKIRYTEYYDLQSTFDRLYADSLNGKTFHNLIGLMASEENIKLAYRTIKGNKQAAYDATVILDDTGGKYINFKLEFPKRKVGADGRK